MQYGIVFPGGSAPQQLELAVMAEECGWDGVFVWESSYGVDPWGTLTVMAQKMSRVKLGTMLTPLAWRRPWKVASQAVTLDQLSNGRAIVAVGLGAQLGDTREEMDRRVRAEMLDEGIDIMRALWEGKVAFEGTHYHVDFSDRDDLVAVASPVQERLPIWCVGGWPRQKSMRRILRCDGLIPQLMDEPPFTHLTPEHLRPIRAWLDEHSPDRTIEIILDGETSADDAAAARDHVAALAEAGATWWHETRWEMPHYVPERMEQVRQRLRAGPPRP